MNHGNQATFIEAARIEKLLQAFLNLQNLADDKFLELLSMSLKEIKHSLLPAHCAQCTLYIVNPEI